VIFFASDWSDPSPVGSNRLVAAQAQELRRQGEDVRILVWPDQGTWSGPKPDVESPKIAGVPVLQLERDGVPYTVLSLPRIFAERFPTAGEWEEMLVLGERLLRALKPSAVHGFFWQGHWWLLAAAQRAGIRTVYTACDYGLLCHRTILVTGSNEPCPGPRSVLDCSACVIHGRGLLGVANELVAELPPARPLLRKAYGDGRGPLAKHGGVRLPVQQRIGFLAQVAGRMLRALDALVVTSPFAFDLFASAGVSRARITQLPWFSARTRPPAALPHRDARRTLRIGAACRISPEKGLHLLLEAAALAHPRNGLSIHLAGSVTPGYGESLRARFLKRAGPHAVEWSDWLKADQVDSFVESMHAIAVPSQWADNTPLAMVEALAAGRPLVCTDISSMTHLARNEINALTFPFGDVKALARVLERLADEDGLVERLAAGTGNMPTLASHSARLAALHAKVAT